jgi:hypothetical protein
MGTLAPNFFEYPLIGSNSTTMAIDRYTDGVGPTEMINYMFKKQFGIPNVFPYQPYNSDIQLQISALNNSTLDKQYSQYIPYNPPTDKVEDTSFNKYGGKRYVSSEYPYMVYYENLQMRTVQEATINAFCVADTNGPDADTNTILTRNAISPFYGNDPNFTSSYQTELKIEVMINNEILQLFFGTIPEGSWLFDVDTGIVTFYDSINSSDYGVITNANPPRISFWRYEGLIGNNTVMSVQDF